MLPCDPEGSNSERGFDVDAVDNVVFSISRDVRIAFPMVRAASAILADSIIRSGTTMSSISQNCVSQKISDQLARYSTVK